ncbi:medium-chain fatty acid-CoA ligase faa2 [Balamuthia mandrillaris]
MSDAKTEQQVAETTDEQVEVKKEEEVPKKEKVEDKAEKESDASSSSDESDAAEEKKEEEKKEEEKKEEEKKEEEKKEEEDASSSSEEEEEKDGGAKKESSAEEEEKEEKQKKEKGKAKDTGKEKGKDKAKEQPQKGKGKEKADKGKDKSEGAAAPAIKTSAKYSAPVAGYKHPLVKNQSAVFDEGEGIRRNAGLPKDTEALPSEYLEGIDTLYKNFQNSVLRFPNNPCLGTREYVKRKGEWSYGRYVWQTYQQIADRVTHFGSGLRHLGLKKGDKVGLWSKNREEWILAEQACNAYGLVTVAIYDTFGEEAVSYVIEHAEISTVVCAPESLRTLSKVIKDCPNLKHVIVMDDLIKRAKKEEDTTISSNDLQHAKAIRWGEVEENGKKNIVEHDPPEPEDLAVLMYTSGTTGNPKGVMLIHNNFTAALAGTMPLIDHVRSNDVYISYLPLAHIFERTCVAGMLGNGAAVGFYTGDPRNLVGDIEWLRPTLMAGVPRVFDRIYQKVNEQVQKGGKLKRMLFTRGYNAKRHKLESGGNSVFWNTLVFSKTKNRLGGRVRLIVSGGAPLGAATQEFIKICFCCPVLQGYGLTETCSAGCVTNAKDNALGQVGPPVLGVEIKLVEVPEMEYSPKNDPPSGEIWIRGPPVSKGYYKDPAKTAEDFDDDGWFHTGDIGCWTKEGTLRIIDRKKNIFKLAIGEYVAAEKLETVFIRSQYVSQIFVYGDSFESSLVAVVVVDPNTLKELAKQKDIKYDDESELPSNKEIRKTLVKDLDEIAKLNKLQRFEYIKAVHIVTEEWTPEGGLVTPTLKPKRPQLKKAYDAEIKQMYQEIAEAAEAGEGAPAASKDAGSSSAEAAKEEGKGKGKGKKQEEKKNKKEEKNKKGEEKKVEEKKVEEKKVEEKEESSSSEEEVKEEVKEVKKEKEAKKEEESSSEEEEAKDEEKKEEEKAEEAESSSSESEADE